MKRLSYLLIAGLSALAACEPTRTVDPVVYECLPDGTPPPAMTPETDRYRKLLDDLTRQGVPGMIMAVKKPGQNLWTGASGFADLKRKVRMQPCQISRAGSTVKMITATALLMLQEEGKLSLDDRAGRYLPASVTHGIAQAEGATIRQLLNHTAGIYNYIQDLRFQTASLNDLTKVWQPGELLDYARNRKPYFPAGEGVRYSNTSYILLGMIIEKVSGMPFSRFFTDRIFRPLGLKNTAFNPNDPVPSGIARGYIDLHNNGRLTESTFYSGWDYYTADGGLISNPADLVRFLEGLFGGKLVSRRSLEEMQRWVVREAAGDFFPLEFGLGMFRLKLPQGVAIYHSGDAIGYFASMMYFPEKGIFIVWQTNGNYGRLDALISGREAYLKIAETVLTEGR
ncbi:serine hydrolase domain-containing protein [Larkinella soli]|uniref:serine hydrolase domain-containing protein n=1 Tax=Larkinella soli TaxID=1770527 RepID=UPI000FFB8F42|nr:serine hydrolase domain-containing protein [Larkinella soli]